MKSNEIAQRYIKPLFTRDYWQMLGDYIGIGRQRKDETINSVESLARLISSRASHVAQASLYGYLRTRAGTRFPTLFENPDLLKSINFAKWHIWLACVSDLSVYIGQHLRQSGQFEVADIQSLLPDALQHLLDDTGEPEEAGPDFGAAREKIVQRIETCDWTVERDDDTVFCQSPEALFYWSPIADELKVRDETIVKNSIRYRWIETRRSIRKQIDCALLAQSLSESNSISTI